MLEYLLYSEEIRKAVSDDNEKADSEEVGKTHSDNTEKSAYADDMLVNYYRVAKKPGNLEKPGITWNLTR